MLSNNFIGKDSFVSTYNDCHTESTGTWTLIYLNKNHHE